MLLLLAGTWLKQRAPENEHFRDQNDIKICVTYKKKYSLSGALRNYNTERHWPHGQHDSAKWKKKVIGAMLVSPMIRVQMNLISSELVKVYDGDKKANKV